MDKTWHIGRPYPVIGQRILDTALRTIFDIDGGEAVEKNSRQ